VRVRVGTRSFTQYNFERSAASRENAERIDDSVEQNLSETPHRPQRTGQDAEDMLKTLKISG